MKMLLAQRAALPWQQWFNLTPLWLGTGLLLQHTLPSHVPLWLGWAIVPLMLSLWVTRYHMLALQSLLAITLLLFGVWLSQWYVSGAGTVMLSKGYWFVSIEAHVDEVIEGEGKQKLVLSHLISPHLAQDDTRVRVRISARMKAGGIQRGDIIHTRVTMFPPSRPSFPAGFDFGRYFYVRDIGGVGYAIGKVSVLPKPKEVFADAPLPFITPILALFASWRKDLQATMLRTLPQPEAGIMLALATGQQNMITTHAREVMQTSSLAHMLAISGMNMVIVCGIVFFMVRLCFACIPYFALHHPIKQYAALCALISGGAYLLLADMPISAARAYVMIAFLFIAVLCNREADTLRSLVLAALVIMLFNPASVAEISFQLSFIATLSLILVYRRIRMSNQDMRSHERGIIRRIFTYIGQMAFTSLVAGLATAPLMIYHFNQFTPYGIIANVLASPLVSFIVSPAMILALVVAPLGLADYPMILAGYGVKAMLMIATWVSSLPYASLHIPALTTPAVIAMTCILFSALAMKRNWQLVLCLIIAFLIGISGFINHTPDILIAEDGSAVAVKSHGNDWLLLKGTARNFHVSQWQQMTAHTFTPYITATKAGMASGWVCTKEWCNGKVNGRVIRVGLDYKTTETLCHPDTEILLTSFYSNRWRCTTHNVLRIDRNALEHGGTHAVWLEKDKKPIVWRACDGQTYHPWMRCTD